MTAASSSRWRYQSVAQQTDYDTDIYEGRENRTREVDRFQRSPSSLGLHRASSRIGFWPLSLIFIQVGTILGIITVVFH